MTPWLFVWAVAFDGDTIYCKRDRAKFGRFNAPELTEPGGREAKDRLAALVGGKRVVYRVVARDRYAKLVCECSTADTPSLYAAVAAGLLP